MVENTSQDDHIHNPDQDGSYFCEKMMTMTILIKTMMTMETVDMTLTRA